MYALKRSKRQENENGLLTAVLIDTAAKQYLSCRYISVALDCDLINILSGLKRKKSRFTIIRYNFI